MRRGVLGRKRAEPSQPRSSESKAVTRSPTWKERPVEKGLIRMLLLLIRGHRIRDHHQRDRRH